MQSFVSVTERTVLDAKTIFVCLLRIEFTNNNKRTIIINKNRKANEQENKLFKPIIPIIFVENEWKLFDSYAHIVRWSTDWTHLVVWLECCALTVHFARLCSFNLNLDLYVFCGWKLRRDSLNEKYVGMNHTKYMKPCAFVQSYWKLKLLALCLNCLKVNEIFIFETVQSGKSSGYTFVKGARERNAWRIHPRKMPAMFSCALSTQTVHCTVWLCECIVTTNYSCINDQWPEKRVTKKNNEIKTPHTALALASHWTTQNKAFVNILKYLLCNFKHRTSKSDLLNFQIQPFYEINDVYLMSVDRLLFTLLLKADIDSKHHTLYYLIPHQLGHKFFPCHFSG